eukprot:4508796-Alexandrium_andersonii.AAC.1
MCPVVPPPRVWNAKEVLQGSETWGAQSHNTLPAPPEQVLSTHAACPCKAYAPCLGALDL